MSEARASTARYLAFYNQRRPHSSLEDRTPDTAYFAALQLKRRDENRVIPAPRAWRSSQATLARESADTLYRRDLT